MTYAVKIDDQSAQLEVRRQGEHYRFRLGPQEEKQAQLLQVEPGLFSVLLNGRSYEARAEPGEDCCWVTIQGRRFRVEITDPRRWSNKTGGRRAEGQENITAPMPGKIVRLLVSAGDAVRAGQGLVVVEAMKMQNEMKARKPGRVVALPVREGDTVSAGAILATIE